MIAHTWLSKNFSSTSREKSSLIPIHFTIYNRSEIHLNLFHYLIPKINFISGKLENTIMSLRARLESEHVERMAINFGISNYRTYFEIKMLFRSIFSKTDIITTFYIGQQIDVLDIDDIKEILRTHHSSLLGEHRGFERMKNLIRRFFCGHQWTRTSKNTLKIALHAKKQKSINIRTPHCRLPQWHRNHLRRSTSTSSVS